MDQLTAFAFAIPVLKTFFDSTRHRFLCSNCRNRRSELHTTNKELNAIRTQATLGSKRPAAARGITTALYRNEKPRFWRMLRIVARLSEITSAARLSDPPARMTSPALIAESVPESMTIVVLCLPLENMIWLAHQLVQS
jgi:hypothetical protein